MNQIKYFTHRSCGMIDDFLGGQIALVAHKQLVDVLTSVPLDFLQPLLHIVEGLLVRAVVDHNDAVRTSIV